MRFLSVLLLLCTFNSEIFASTIPESDHSKQTKSVQSKRRVHPITIDGIVTTHEWNQATLLEDFVELRPKPGNKEPENAKTIAYITYDDQGIYFGGICYEPSRDRISAELAGRDGFGNNDFVGLILDTYKDNLNGFEYFITPLNEQWDAKQAPNPNGDSEDFSWNSVWKSATHIDDTYWSFEIFIPFASIRFAERDIQDWGLNVTRRRRKTEEQYFWNPIDPNVNGFMNQEGYLTGLTDIKPPVRLQLSPYLSYYANHYPIAGPTPDLTTAINGGMDLKWGINQAFTLDATLIPDFGQVQSDPQVFNLSPFEVRFDENRDFFTEGMELFNQGGLFYSRRVGGTPINYWGASDDVQSNEKVVSNPSETKLLNASKISGRTHSGLGVGVMNAITDETYAVIEDTLTGEKRNYKTAPLINYNVFVLNQSLKNNSSISFVNTNVTRTGDFYDSNVSAFIYDVNNKKNTWGSGGQASVSQKWDPASSNETGYYHSFYAGKTGGRVRFNYWQELADTKYSNNDLGYFTNNNYLTQGAWVGIQETKPKGWYNRLNLNFNVNYSRLLKPIGEGNPMYQFSRFNFNWNSQHKKLHYIGGNINFDFVSNDFYEPRVEGRYFKKGYSGLIGFWFESNSNKAWFYSPSLYMRYYPDFYNTFALDFDMSQTWRANERLSMSLGFSWLPRWNSIGFTTNLDTEIDPVFAKRDVQTFVTSLRGKYNFTNRMGLTMVARHYVSSLSNSQLYLLNTNGSLRSTNTNPEEYDRTVNFINVDMVYTWQFAQGSFLSLVWKFAVNRFDQTYNAHYFQNLKDTFRENQNNTVSVRMIYFLDYNSLKNQFKS
ncbi:hypothetical protein EP331_06210 [bacterium]|nr:MAG: hypothetical protein EP331_06210 [bacterium]